jgi:hypothetical protein
MTRMVSIDEFFTWREDLGWKAKEAFGGWECDVSPRTFADLKVRSDVIEREADPFFERTGCPKPVPLNGIRVHVGSSVPDGFLAPCVRVKAGE